MPRARPTEPFLKRNSRGTWDIVHWDGESRIRISTRTGDEIVAKQELTDYRAILGRRPCDIATALDDYITNRTGKTLATSRLIEASVPLKSYMGHLRLDQVSQDLWDKYCNQRMTRRNGKQKTHTPRPVARGTLKREFNVLMAAVRLAWKAGRIGTVPHIEVPSDSPARSAYLSDAESRALIAASDGHVKVFVMLALMTGARRSAILALTWDRVDFAHGTIDFDEPGRPKSKKRRAIVPINGQLRAALVEAHGSRSADCPNVVQYFGKAVPTGLRWSFKKACQRAGLTWEPTPHVLKHYQWL